MQAAFNKFTSSTKWKTDSQNFYFDIEIQLASNDLTLPVKV